MNSVELKNVLNEVAKKLKLTADEKKIFMKEVEAGLATEWLTSVENLQDDNLLERFKIACNIVDEDDECNCENDYVTDERYFVYDKDDNCVSDGFKYEDGAIAFANSCGYPIVKIHRYYRDHTRGYKLYSDDEPEIVWKDGKPYEYNNI